ncbi:MAG: porin [Gammaproteobacteria bacterium]|nr:porin [Gammaproteobacteria bacterium]MCP5137067.1 porin [Gammaproteobacteria bacterium]
MTTRFHFRRRTAASAPILLAITGLTTPALADDISIYGTMHYAWEVANTHDATGDTTDDATGVNHASVLGFEGSEDLGDGYKAFFVIESDIGGNLGSNNSFVGIDGEFGAILLGQMDTPYKNATIDWNVWGDTSGDYIAIIGADAAGNNNFDVLAPQAIAYISPELDGLQFAIARIALKDTDTPGDKNDVAWSTSLTYDNGPLSAAIAYESHDGDTLGLGSTDAFGEDAWRIGAQYSFGDSTVAVVYEDIEHDDGTARQSRAAYWLSFTQQVGNDTFNISYARAGDSDVAGGDDGARQLTLGVQHAFSERTGIYALYSTVDNDRNAQYGLAGGGFAASGPGRDVDAFSFGIVHSF